MTACFLFLCTLQFCDSWRPGSKNAEVLVCLNDSLTFCAAPSPSLSIYSCCAPVCVSVNATFSLFLYRSLCSHFFSLSPSVSPSLVFPSGVSPKAPSWTKPTFLLWLMPPFAGSRDQLEVNSPLTQTSHEHTPYGSPLPQLCRLMLLK